MSHSQTTRDNAELLEISEVELMRQVLDKPPGHRFVCLECFDQQAIVFLMRPEHPVLAALYDEEKDVPPDHDPDGQTARVVPCPFCRTVSGGRLQ